MLPEEHALELNQPADVHRFMEVMDTNVLNAHLTKLPLMETPNVNQLLVHEKIKFLESHKTAMLAENAKMEPYQML